MRATIRLMGIILTKAHTTTVSFMVEWSIVSWVLPLMCVLFLLPKPVSFICIVMSCLVQLY